MPRYSNQEKLPSEQAMLIALQENWAHARQGETMRLRYTMAYLFAFGAMISFLITQKAGHPDWISLLAQYWLVSSLLAAVGVVTCGMILKLNEEFGNHIRTIQYIARDLGLSDAGDPTQSETFTTYMGLPLPLPVRVQRGFGIIVSVSCALATAAGSAGLARHILVYLGKHSPVGAYVLGLAAAAIVLTYLERLTSTMAH